MKPLLIVLCVIGSLLGVFVGGCGLWLASIGVAAGMAEPVVMAALVGGAGILVMLVNVALINAVRRGETAGRGAAFLALAGVDLFAACCAVCLGNEPLDGAWLALPLAIKGLLTIVLVFRGARNMPQDAADHVDRPKS